MKFDEKGYAVAVVVLLFLLFMSWRFLIPGMGGKAGEGVKPFEPSLILPTLPELTLPPISTYEPVPIVATPITPPPVNNLKTCGCIKQSDVGVDYERLPMQGWLEQPYHYEPKPPPPAVNVTVGGGGNNLLGVILGIGLGLLFSDARVKRNIENVGYQDEGFFGSSKVGLPTYSYEYTGLARLFMPGGKQYGVMAQDVENVQPDAIGNSMGFMTVDYQRLN